MTAPKARLASHLPCTRTTVFYPSLLPYYHHRLTSPRRTVEQPPLRILLAIMSRTNPSSSALRRSGATAVFRPGAEARTPFGTPFFKLAIDPNTDIGTFQKWPLGTKVREEVRAWEKLQRTGKLPENRSYAGVLQENRVAFAGNEKGDVRVDAPTAERAGVGAGFVVGGPGYPAYFVPDVDGPVVSGGNDDRLWPDTYSDVSDSDIDYVLDGFVVIDMADATGSVFWKQPRRRGRRKVSSQCARTWRGTLDTHPYVGCQVTGRRGSPSLWARFLSRLRPAGGTR